VRRSQAPREPGNFSTRQGRLPPPRTARPATPSQSITGVPPNQSGAAIASYPRETTIISNLSLRSRFKLALAQPDDRWRFDAAGGCEEDISSYARAPPGDHMSREPAAARPLRRCLPPWRLRDTAIEVDMSLEGVTRKKIGVPS
jgi:hypothetical protein